VDRYDVNKFKGTNICESFKRQLQETMNRLDINQEKIIDIKWKAVKTTIKTVTETVIGKQKKTRKPWFNNSREETFGTGKEASTQ